MMILGLTGSIGMGKSRAARAFARQGAMIWDADAAVHRLMACGGAAVTPVTAEFPESRVEENGSAAVDRTILGKLVFQEKAALCRLESILHPLVRSAERRFLASVESRRCRLVVLDIPLLFESGGERRCDATAAVSAPAFVQRARVLARPNMTVSKYEAILARQLPDEEKRRRADFVIRTGLNKRVSEEAVRRISKILSTRRGAHWPLSWPVKAS